MTREDFTRLAGERLDEMSQELHTKMRQVNLLREIRQAVSTGTRMSVEEADLSLQKSGIFLTPRAHA